MKMPLREAFSKLQAARPYARPNLTFFEQLIKYEQLCLGKATVEIVNLSGDLLKSNLATARRLRDHIRVPDFYRKEYPHLLKLEAEVTDTGSMAAGSCSLAESVVAESSVHSDASDTEQAVTNELKPFILEKVVYTEFIAEFERNKHKRKLKHSK